MAHTTLVACPTCGTDYRPELTLAACPVCGVDAPGDFAPRVGLLGRIDPDTRMVGFAIGAMALNLIFLAVVAFAIYR